MCINQAYMVRICNCDVYMKVKLNSWDSVKFDRVIVIMSQANTLLACDIVSG